MKKAEEMRKIANEFHKERERKLFAKVGNFVNQILAPKVETEAQSGKCDLETLVDYDIIEYVIKELEALGYELKKTSAISLHIWW